MMDDCKSASCTAAAAACADHIDAIERCNAQALSKPSYANIANVPLVLEHMARSCVHAWTSVTHTLVTWSAVLQVTPVQPKQGSEPLLHPLKEF